MIVVSILFSDWIESSSTGWSLSWLATSTAIATTERLAVAGVTMWTSILGFRRRRSGPIATDGWCQRQITATKSSSWMCSVVVVVAINGRRKSEKSAREANGLTVRFTSGSNNVNSRWWRHCETVQVTEICYTHRSIDQLNCWCCCCCTLPPPPHHRRHVHSHSPSQSSLIRQESISKSTPLVVFLFSPTDRLIDRASDCC